VVALKNPAADSQPAIEKSQQQMILESPYARSPHLWRLDSATIPAANCELVTNLHRYPAPQVISFYWMRGFVPHQHY
jgi:hypothetical protein